MSAERRRYTYLPQDLEGERFKLWETYEKLGLNQHAERIVQCPGTKAECRDPRKFKCHDPLCPYCCWRHGLRNFYKYDYALLKSHNPWLFTLMVPPQTYRVKHVLKAWSKILRKPWFKRFVYGGCRFIEIKELIRNSGVLDPHLHIIIDLNQDIWGNGGISLLEFADLLIEAWQTLLPFANGGRYIHYEQIDNTNTQERRNILKYGFKAPTGIRNIPALVVQFWEQLRGVHRCAAFGNWLKKRTCKRAPTVYYYKVRDTAQKPKSARWSVGWEELRQNLRE